LSSWVEEWCDRLQVMREVALKNSLVELGKQKIINNASVYRTFSIEDKVFCRILGLVSKL